MSRGDDFTNWDSVLIPFPPQLKPSFAETTVWADGAYVLAVIRGGAGVAWVSTSDDHGKTWAKARPSNLPMPRAKAYLGRLNTGQLYLTSITAAPSNIKDCPRAPTAGFTTPPFTAKPDSFGPSSFQWRTGSAANRVVTRKPASAKAGKVMYGFTRESFGRTRWASTHQGARRKSMS